MWFGTIVDCIVGSISRLLRLLDWLRFSPRLDSSFVSKQCIGTVQENLMSSSLLPRRFVSLYASKYCIKTDQESVMSQLLASCCVADREMSALPWRPICSLLPAAFGRTLRTTVSRRKYHSSLSTSTPSEAIIETWTFCNINCRGGQPYYLKTHSAPVACTDLVLSALEAEAVLKWENGDA